MYEHVQDGYIRCLQRSARERKQTRFRIRYKLPSIHPFQSTQAIAQIKKIEKPKLISDEMIHQFLSGSEPGDFMRKVNSCELASLYST